MFREDVKVAFWLRFVFECQGKGSAGLVFGALGLGLDFISWGLAVIVAVLRGSDFISSKCHRNEACTEPGSVVLSSSGRGTRAQCALFELSARDPFKNRIL